MLNTKMLRIWNGEFTAETGNRLQNIGWSGFLRTCGMG